SQTPACDSPFHPKPIDLFFGTRGLRKRCRLRAMIALLRPRSRRRLRWLALLSLRVVRRHYLTLVSALVLVAAGVVALTDAGLAVDGGVAARTDTGVASAPETPAPAATVAPPDRSGGPHTVVYYMLKSELQRSEFEMAIQADMRDWYRRGLPVDGPV